MARDDYVEIRLTKKGAEAAGVGTVRIVNALVDVEVRAGETHRVSRAEWTEIFSLARLDGEPLFEITAAAEPAKPAMRQKAERS